MGLSRSLKERAAELEHARGMVVPVLKVQTAGREQLAKCRQRAEKKCNMRQEVAEEGDAAATSYSGRAAASVFSAAATSIVQFQRLFNYEASHPCMRAWMHLWKGTYIHLQCIEYFRVDTTHFEQCKKHLNPHPQTHCDPKPNTVPADSSSILAY